VRALDEVPTALASLTGHAPPGKQVIAVTPPDPTRAGTLRPPAAVGAAIG